MSVWRPLAFAVVVCSPAALMTGVFAATATGSDAGAPLSSQRLLQFAQSGEQPAGDTAGGAGNAAPVAPAAPSAADEETAAAEEEGDEGPAVFTEAFLQDPAQHAAGKVVWETCSGCHGARAYPGKAPKLRPKRYEPDFVFDRVTNGYKKMPSWKDVFTKEERMAVVAYILSKDFSP